MGRIIAVLNQKGGVGKTTTAINVGAYLAKLGKKVLLIDLDPQGNATSGLGFDKLQLSDTTYSLLLEKADANNVRHSTSVKNLDLLPTNSDLSGAEVQLATMPKREHKLKGVIHNIAADYDIVLIDCPPSLGLLTVNALVAATDVLIPVQTEYYAMEGLSQLIQTIQF